MASAALTQLFPIFSASNSTSSPPHKPSVRRTLTTFHQNRSRREILKGLAIFPLTLIKQPPSSERLAPICRRLRLTLLSSSSKLLPKTPQLFARYYNYVLETPFALTGSHNVAKATAKGNTVVLFVASANDK